MSVSVKDVEHIAKLARLRLTDDEKIEYTGQLNNILEYMEKLNELDTDNVSPLTHPMEKENVFREDIVKESLPREKALKNAPKSNDEHFLVPRVIKGSGK